MENFDPKTIYNKIQKSPNQWTNSDFIQFLEDTNQNSVKKALKKLEKEENKSEGEFIQY